MNITKYICSWFGTMGHQSRGKIKIVLNRFEESKEGVPVGGGNLASASNGRTPVITAMKVFPVDSWYGRFNTYIR